MTQSSPETKDPLIGQSIDHGRYELLRVIGEGGMGKVYEARQKRVDRLVAVKVLHSHWAKDPKLVARFKREALTASQFRHPNTVMIYDYGETTNGDLYIIMELLKGQSLLSLLEKEGPLSLDRALKIIDQVCGAVTEVHRCGVIHRDLKPENIQIDPRDGHPDFVKLLDFSIAKLVNDNTLSSMDTKQNLTLQGAVFGTPQYMSPEQVRGRSLDQRTDLYAIGVIFYQMLSGFVPFSEQTPQGTMMAHLTEPIPRFEDRVPHLDIHPAAAQLIYDCLEKDPQDRVKSSDALTQRLLELRFTLQREEELNAEPDTDLGTPQVTSRLTSASGKDLDTEERPFIPSQGFAQKSNETDESLPHLESSSKSAGLVSSLIKKQKDVPPQRLVQANKPIFFETSEDEALEQEAKDKRPSTEETQEFNPKLHGVIEKSDSNPDKNSDEQVNKGPSITSAVTMGVEELEFLEPNDELSHEASKSQLKNSQEIEKNQPKDSILISKPASASKLSNEVNAELNPSVDDHESNDSSLHAEPSEESQSAVSAISVSVASISEHDQKSDDVVDSSNAQETPVESETSISNTDEFHAVENLDYVSEQSVNSKTQELQKIDQSDLKETLPLYGLQASALIKDAKESSLVSQDTFDSEQISTGVFAPVKPKRNVGLSLALVSAIALIVFVTLNPHLLQKLKSSFNSPTVPAKKITLGSSKLELSYHLSSKPKGQVYNRKSGQLLGETPLSWQKTDPKFNKVLFEVRAKGYTSQIVSLAAFNISSNDPKLRELHLQLKPIEHKPEAHIPDQSSDQTSEAQTEDPTRINKAKPSKNKDKGKVEAQVKAKAPSNNKSSKKRAKPKKKSNHKRRKSRTKSKRKSAALNKSRSSNKTHSPNKTAKSNQTKKTTAQSSSKKESKHKAQQVKKKVPELPTLSPSDPVDTSRFKDTIEIEKLP